MMEDLGTAASLKAAIPREIDPKGASRTMEDKHDGASANFVVVQPVPFCFP